MRRLERNISVVHLVAEQRGDSRCPGWRDRRHQQWLVGKSFAQRPDQWHCRHDLSHGDRVNPDAVLEPGIAEAQALTDTLEV